MISLERQTPPLIEEIQLAAKRLERALQKHPSVARSRRRNNSGFYQEINWGAGKIVVHYRDRQWSLVHQDYSGKIISQIDAAVTADQSLHELLETGFSDRSSALDPR